MSVMLSQDEIRDLTGYVQPHAQLMELRRQGFHRARRNALGVVILERAHFDAVCAGALPAQPSGRNIRHFPAQPKLACER